MRNREKIKKLTMQDFKPTFWSTFFSFLGIVLLICLGTWQLHRLDWKTNLIRERESGFFAPSVTINSKNHLEQYFWRRVEVSGSFDHSKELFLAARSLRGNVGFHILTPFKQTNGKTILINRGWVPREKKESSSRLKGQIQGQITLEGILTPGSGKGPFTPENDKDKNVWLYVNFKEMSDIVGVHLEPAVIDMIETAPGGFPIGSQTRINLPNDHMQYAITWYALALALACVWFVWNKNRTK
tara:strand:- start:1450 stop:2175 length:726 start_codon:yes stop_codon:yes gene_type:complete